MTTRTRPSATSNGLYSRRRGILTSLMAMLETRRQRDALSKLDDHLLDDIGLPRDTAAREAAKPLWDVPGHWLR